MTLRLLHLSNDLYPRIIGGTEIFIRQLIDAQRLGPAPTTILWAAHEAALTTRHEGDPPPLGADQRLLPAIVPGTRHQLISGVAEAIPGFSELLADFRPDVVHLHSFSDRCGLSHARAIREAGIPFIVTVHTPGFSCIKGNLIDASGSICDGRLCVRRCTRCRLHNGGLPRWLAAAVALQGGWPLSADSGGSLSHVLTARQLTAAFQKGWLTLATQAEALHVLAEWSRKVLLGQGLPVEKIHLLRTAGPAPLPPKRRQPMADGVLRLVYWGRCHPVKGLHLVIEAILALPREAPIQLDCYGPYWEGSYGQTLLSQIRGDRRFRILGSLAKEELLPHLQGYDLAVVPSTWLETGPLTVLESLAAGLPVAGSALGGIQELLEGVPGCALLPLDVGAWRELFQHLLADPSSLAWLKPRVRQFSDLAQDLQTIYATCQLNHHG